MKKNIVFLITVLLKSLFVFAQNDVNYFINAAKQNSPLINDNQNQSKVNQLEAERLKAFYTKPQIGVTASYLFSPIINLDNNQTRFEPNSVGADKYIGYDFAAANGGQYQALLNITQPLFNGGKLKTVSEQVNIAAQVNQNNVKLSAHDIVKVVTDQYILCVQDSRQTEYANAMLVILAEQKSIIQKLVESSIYKQSDLALLNIECRSFELQLATCRAVYKRDVMDLNILCGINDTTNILLDKINLVTNINNQNSLFTEKYRLDSLNIIAAKNIFEIKYKPQLSAIANTGLNAVYAPTIPNRFGLNAGFTFAYNFFDGKQKSINANKADVQLKSVAFYKNNFNVQNNLRKTKILNELQSYNSRVAISELQLKEYATLLNLYKKEIITGQLSIINYVTTLKNLATIQRDNNILITQQQLLINAYNYWNW